MSGRGHDILPAPPPYFTMWSGPRGPKWRLQKSRTKTDQGQLPLLVSLCVSDESVYSRYSKIGCMSDRTVTVSRMNAVEEG